MLLHLRSQQIDNKFRNINLIHIAFLKDLIYLKERIQFEHRCSNCLGRLIGNILTHGTQTLIQATIYQNNDSKQLSM